MITPEQGSVLTDDQIALLKDGDWILTRRGHPFQFLHADDMVAPTDTFIGRPDPDGWLVWSGGENPVPGQRVRVLIKGLGDAVNNGHGLSDDLVWSWAEQDARAWDIIAFRLSSKKSEETTLRSVPVAAEGDTVCHDCRAVNPVWFAPNDLWRRALGGAEGVLCPICFIAKAEAAGVRPTAWMICEEPLEKVDPAVAEGIISRTILDACCDMHIDIPVESHEAIAALIVTALTGNASANTVGMEALQGRNEPSPHPETEARIALDRLAKATDRLMSAWPSTHVPGAPLCVEVSEALNAANALLSPKGK